MPRKEASNEPLLLIQPLLSICSVPLEEGDPFPNRVDVLALIEEESRDAERKKKHQDDNRREKDRKGRYRAQANFLRPAVPTIISSITFDDYTNGCRIGFQGGERDFASVTLAADILI